MAENAHKGKTPMRASLVALQVWALLFALTGDSASAAAPVDTATSQVFDFSHGHGDWKLYNYESRVSFCVTNIDGVSGFAAYVPGVKMPVEKGKRVKVDHTAWGIHGPFLDAAPGQGFSLALRLRSTVAAQKASGSDHATSYVSFFDGDGIELESYFPILLPAPTNAWQTVDVYGRIPDGAKKFRINVGLDRPNMVPGDSFVLANIVLTLYPAGPPAHCRVTLRDDGGVMVGGKPFFPIGVFDVGKDVWSSNELQVAMRSLKEIGVNLVQTYYVSRNGTLRRFMDAAHAAGLKTWVPAGESNAVFKEKYILAERWHPSILGWYLGDDTATGLSAAEIFRRHEVCHSLDPDRITLQADYLNGRRSSRYFPYVNMTDVFLPEIYTVYMIKQSGREVPDVICDIKTVKSALYQKGVPNKSFWPIIQYFQGWREWHRFPTLQELRAMTFEAIVCGGRGVTFYTYSDSKKRPDWWGYGMSHSPENWATFSKVVREVASLQSHLSARDAAKQPCINVVSGPKHDICGYRSVHGLLKETGLFMAVNSSTNDIVAEVSLPENGRRETLTIEPYGVIVKNFK